MSEEEELKGIRREVWWLSTFLVKIPLIISALVAVVWIAQSCSGDVDVLSIQPTQKTINKVALAIIAIAVSIGLLSYFLWNSKADKERRSFSEDEANPDSNEGDEYWSLLMPSQYR